MSGKLHSLTDVLKKTLFFFEELSVAEVVPHVHRKMLKDYSQEQVEEKVTLCLRQNPCFIFKENGLWLLNLEGNRENDQFYAVLLKRQQPMSIREVLKAGINPRSKKKVKPLVAGEASLISDGRFIQLDNGHWGLTEWEVEAGQYSLKQLVIKAHKAHPGGLSAQQIFEIVQKWKDTDLKAVGTILNKLPYFEKAGDGIWVYNPSVHVAYEEMMKRFISSLGRMKDKWQKDRTHWKNRIESLESQIHEVNSSYRETAAALAVKMEEAGRHDYLVTQMAEKDLLLSLRKKEIYRYREHVSKLEAKANSILHQCRLWVKRAREAGEEKERLKEALAKNQSSLESLFTKLQQYKEKDRENKARLAEIKENHSTRTAELQSEIVDLRQKMEKLADAARQEEKQYREEINILSNDLKEALENGEEAKRSVRFLQQELAKTRTELRKVEDSIKSPLVKALIKLIAFLSKTKNTTVS